MRCCLCSTCSVSQRCKKTRVILPFGGRFVAEIFVQNFRVSQRGADVSYILIQLLLLYLKNLLIIQLDVYFCRSNPSQPHIYNACAQCLCIVLAQCHSAAKRRGLLPFGGRFGAEIFVQNFKWRVSQRGADVSYILIQLLLLYLKNLLSYTAWHNYFQALFLPFKSFPATYL